MLFVYFLRVEGIEGGEVGGCGVEFFYLLLGCLLVVCELGVVVLLFIDFEKWRVGRENVEIGGK